MERKILLPDQIITSDPELGNESILKIYFGIFEKGHGKDLPPIIITSADRDFRISRVHAQLLMDIGKKYICENELPSKNIRTFDKFGMFIKKAPYYLLDGNHRATAATLTHSPIYALELQSSEDLSEVRTLSERGELFGFERSENSLEELVCSFEEHLHVYLHHPERTTIPFEDIENVKMRTDRFVSQDYLPHYMKERYLQNKV